MKKLFLSGLTIVVGLAIGLIPTWIFLITKHSLEPAGFWQNLLIYGLGFYLLAGIQIVLFICAIVGIVTVIGFILE